MGSRGAWAPTGRTDRTGKRVRTGVWGGGEGGTAVNEDRPGHRAGAEVPEQRTSLRAPSTAPPARQQTHLPVMTQSLSPQTGFGADGEAGGLGRKGRTREATA